MSEKKYKISVIIPVYNCEKYVQSCIKSLSKQSMPMYDFQIVLINDGSTDSSAEICKKAAKKHSNITYFEKENGGVSSARNKGLELSEGKYIMFLDSDDTVSSNCLKEIYDFFEEHASETDLVTYSLNYLHENGSITTNKRFNVLSHTGVYDINYDTNLLQSTMNICVKNVDKKDRILFDEDLTLGEDQWFIFSWLMRKQKIGFVKEAVYLYYRHSGSASQIFNNPFYCFDQYTSFLQRLLSYKKDNNGRAHTYAQALVVYNFGWRLVSDQLISHIDKETENSQLDVLRNILRQVDDTIICTSIFIDPYYIEYLMKLKGGSYEVALNDSTVTAFNGDELWFSQPMTVSFCVFKIKGNKCLISGFVKNCFIPLDQIEFYCGNNDNNDTTLRRIMLRDTAYSYYKGKHKTNRFGGFDFSIDLNDVNTLTFKVKVGEIYVTPSLQFEYKCCVSARKKLAACGDYTVEFITISKCVCINKADRQELIHARAAANISVAAENRKAWIYRKLSLLARTKKEIWLYNDREGILDNAYYQFIHDFDKDDGIERYYVVNKFKHKSRHFTAAQRRHLIRFKSLDHKIKFINCSKIFTSFNSPSNFSPFGAVPLRWYSDLTHYDVIYLQHGILHASLPLLYSKEKANVDKVVVSSQFERKNFIDNYGFNDEDLIMTGMPRFDSIDTEIKAKNRILFSPSWRKSLIGEYVNNTRELFEKRFTESVFFNSVNDFLNSPELAALLEKNDLYLDFNNHPIFRDYDKLFVVDNPRITVTQEKRDMQEYLAMITDYSSFVFDFVYLARPVIYFVPDYDEFKAGITHNYCALDLPLEEGFGEITLTGDELLAAINRLIENHFNLSEPYKTRMETFFNSREPHHADALYENLINE